MTDESTPTTAPAKPGYKTSEFWMKIAAMLLSTLFASGVIPVGGTAERIAAIAATMLGALGYTVSRSMVKAAGVLLFVGLCASTQSACSGTAGQRLEDGGKAAFSCELPTVVSTALQLRPTFEQALAAVISNDGLHIDKPRLKSVLSSIVEPSLMCAAKGAIVALLHPAAPQPGAPMAAATVAPADLGTAYSAIAAELGWPAEVR